MLFVFCHYGSFVVIVFWMITFVTSFAQISPSIIIVCVRLIILIVVVVSCLMRVCVVIVVVMIISQMISIIRVMYVYDVVVIVVLVVMIVVIILFGIIISDSLFSSLINVAPILKQQLYDTFIIIIYVFAPFHY